MYLGDGHIARLARTYQLRVYTDLRWPAVIGRIAYAMRTVMPGNKTSVVLAKAARMAIVTSHSKAWPCLLPQHGPGPKSARQIALERWQEALLDPGPFVRGLIHSDGCRVLNRVNGKDYPRYFFTQKSEDVKGLFCRSCDQLGITYQTDHPRHISIARAASVARLDALGGSKQWDHTAPLRLANLPPVLGQPARVSGAAA